MNEISLIKAVLTYSIDNYDHENNEILKKINLNADAFYNSKIYKKRIKKEQEIKEAIDSPSGVIKILGKAGSGKTTVTNKVLRDYVDEYIAEKIDIKKLTGIEDPKLKSGAELTKFLNSALLTILINILNENDILRDDINEYYLLSKKGSKIRDHIKRNEKYIKLESKINQTFNRNKRKTNDNISLNDWMLSLLVGTQEDKLFDDLFEIYKPEDLVYFLRNKLNLFRGCIFFFDNVDSIIDEEVRLAFFNLIDKYQSEKSDCMTIIISFRSNNPSLTERTDHGSFNSMEINMDLISGESFDPDDLTTGETNILKFAKTSRTHYLDTEDEEPNLVGLTRKQIYYLKRKFNSRKNERFALQLIYRRIYYLLQNNEKIKHLFDFDFIEEVVQLILTFLRDKHLSLTTATIGNFNRRETLLIISDFIKHLYENQLNKKIIGSSSSREKMTFYESHYYQWLGSKTSILPKNLRNIYHELKYWKKNKKRHSGCLFDLQLLNLILNDTDPSDENVRQARKLIVGDLIEVFANLNISSEQIKEGIFRLYKQDGKPLGMIELSRFYGVTSAIDICEDDEIWLTPRGESYIMYINLKYSYLFALISEESKIDLEPISTPTMKNLFRLLIEVGEMYFNGLRNIKSKLTFSFPDQKNDFWIEYYLNKFTISTPAQEKILTKVKYKDLHYTNLLSSHIKYLSLISKQNKDQKTNQIINKAFGNYSLLISRFDQLIDKVVNNTFNENIDVKKNLGSGISW